MYLSLHKCLDITFLWKKFPVLLISLYYSLGILCYFHTGVALVLFLIFSPLLIPCAPNHSYKHTLISIVTTLLGFSFTNLKIDLPPRSILPLYGSARVHINGLEKQDFFFGPGYIYRGIITSFSSPSKNYSFLPCSIYSKDKSYIIDCDYLITGELCKSKSLQYTLKPQKGITWEPIPNTFSLAELRFRCKKCVQKFLRKRLSNKHIFSLISALSTGNSPNLIVKYHFSRLGLSHLLVISGFHFSILALLAKKILDFFFSEPITTIFLLLFTISYGIYVGPQASSMRAGLIIYIYLLGRLIGRKSPPLNTLGGALLIQLLGNPLLLFQIGFQLSYVATLGILLFFPSYKKKLEKLLPRRDYAYLNPLLKVYQIMINFIRNQLALLFSSHILLLPVLLYHFSSFPILTFFYNLLIPVLISFCFITLPFLLIPGIMFIPQIVASFLWIIVMYAPQSLNVEVYCPFMPWTGVLIFLSLSFMYKLFDYNIQRKNLFFDCL